ncbi:MAG: thioredoxin family protein, partial [Chitinophagaceae bacterium]|nr:thioredoxin family protein [Chitinophagaceae bacterium]
CGPCRMMKPILKELYEMMGQRLRIIKVDVDQSPEAANAYQVHSVPTLILFQKGRILWRQSGVVPAATLKKIVETHIK